MNDTAFRFDVEDTDGEARAASYSTPHGVIETPAFVAVGTQASIKAVPPEMALAAGVSVLFANTYHLYLRPGEEVVALHGGLHRFMNWPLPIMTDSGGFQVFSLGAGIEHGVGKIASIFPGEERAGQARAPRLPQGASRVQVTEQGVTFKSHIDGSSHLLTPERSIEVQRALGADMILAFDECTSPLHDDAYTKASMERTHRWAQRCLEAFQREPPQHGYSQALFGIVQGGALEALRRQSARTIAAMDFDGVAIGGNLGRTKQELRRVVEWTVEHLPRDKPRHLLGIGEVPDMFDAAARGCDTFDCVSPTRNARNGAALVRSDDAGRPLKRFRINLRNERFAKDVRPIDENCDCVTCAHYSRAYLRHLFKAEERLAQTLTTIHNLRFMTRLCQEIRGAISERRLDALMQEWLEPVGLYARVESRV